MGIIKAKAVSTFLIVYSPSSTERLSPNIKLTLHMALIRSCNELRLTHLGICGRHSSSENAVPAKQDDQHNWQFYKAPTDQRFLCGFQDSVVHGFNTNYAGSTHRYYENMTTKIFATLNKAKYDTGNVRGLNLLVVKFTNFQLSNCRYIYIYIYIYICIYIYINCNWVVTRWQ